MSHLESALTQIRALVGDRLSTAMAVRQHHGADASWHPPLPPDAVVYAHSTEEVSAIVKICAATVPNIRRPNVPVLIKRIMCSSSL